MTATVIRRFGGAILTILAVLTFVFFVIRITGDPTSYLLPFDYTDEQKAALEAELGVDKPLPQQYVAFLGDLMRGDLGFSHRWSEGALGMVFDRLPATFRLASVAFLLTVSVSLPLGILAAARRGSALDGIIGGATTTGQAMPNFVLAVLLVWLFAVKLQWLPVGGEGGWKSYILPAVTLAAFPIASQTRIVRAAVSDVLTQDYIRTARAKGLSSRTVLTTHALRAAAVPILTIIGLQWQYFLGGTVIIETVFAWPGIGRLMVDAVQARDFAVVQSGVFVLSSIFIAINALTDIAYSWADPRYRAGGRA
ncbi:MAG: ABC transporter permease [Dehalococcoidia bacterium]|nr:ABC transporter permease [Dehalococcoidia bacterium]